MLKRIKLKFKDISEEENHNFCRKDKKSIEKKERKKEH